MIVLYVNSNRDILVISRIFLSGEVRAFLFVIHRAKLNWVQYPIVCVEPIKAQTHVSPFLKEYKYASDFLDSYSFLSPSIDFSNQFLTTYYQYHIN